MFFHNDALCLAITGIYYVKGEPCLANEKNRTHAALSYRIKGNSKIYCGEKLIELTDGSLAYFPAGVDYRRITESSEEYIVIHLTSYGDSTTEVESIANCQPLYPFFETLLSDWEHDKRARCRVDLYRLLEEAERFTSKDEAPIPEAIRVGVEYMREHFRANDLSISTLAQLCHVSETYFRRIYHGHFHSSPMQDLLEMRFDFAKNLLRSGYYQTKEVAALSGFSDVKYFRTAFKKRFGITPVQYIRGVQP